MAETTEFLTLLNCTGKLEIALQSDRELAQFLNKEGFITDEVYADVSSTTSVQTSIQKAGTLIFHIKNKVKLNPKRYHKLVCHLRQNKRKYEDIVNILEEEYYRLVCDSSQDDHTDVSQMDAVDVPSYQKQGDSDSRLIRLINQVDDTPLDEDDLPELRKALVDVSSRWKDFGISFGLKSSKLKEIGADGSKRPLEYFCEVLTELLTRNYNVEKFGELTWRKIVEVVADPTAGDNTALAEVIAKEHTKKVSFMLNAAHSACSLMESRATKLKAHLNTFKEVDKAEMNSAVKDLIKEQIEEFITTCLKISCNPDDVRDILTNIHHTDFLISNETLKWAMERVDSIAVQSIAKSDGDCSNQPSTKEDKKLFCDDVIYHATLCSHAASTCDENDFKKFFNEDHQHHNLDEASLSITRKREEVDRYLIARKGKIYFIAFKSESLLSDWQEKFTSFAEGIQLQTDRIPLRFLIQQLHDGFQIVLTGFSYGGLLALSVTASLWQQPNLLSSDLLQRNVCCVAFGLPLFNLPHIQEAIDESPELASTIHSFYVKNDIFPQLNIFFDPVCESILDDLGDFNDMGDFDPKLKFQGLTTSCIINNLSALQKVHQNKIAKDSICAVKSRLQAKLPHLLASGLIQKQSHPYNTYLIDSESGLALHPLTKEEAMVELKNLTQPLIDAMDDRLFHRHSMSNYTCKICKILKFECEITPESLTDLEVAEPNIESVSFHRHGKEIAVTIKGRNLWFCYQVKVGKHTEKIKAENVSKQSIQFNYDPELNRKISSDSTEINVSMWTHFYEQTRKKVKIDHKVYEFTFRQEQLAKLNPSELIEAACMSALLEQHPHSQRKEVKYFSKRFETLRKFLEQAVSVVPVESILFAAAHTNDADISRQCCTHLMKSSIILPPSLLASDGYMGAVTAIICHTLERELEVNYGDEEIGIQKAIGERELRKQFKRYKRREKLNPMEQKVNRKNFFKHLYKNVFSHVNRIVDKRVIQQYFTKLGIEPRENCDLLVFLGQSYIHVMFDHISTSAQDAISSDNLSSVYMIQSESDAAMCLKPPLNILVEGRKKLSWLSKQTLQGPMSETSSDSPIKLSQLYNSKMLQIVNDFRSKEVRVSCLLLAAFMEEQVKVPLMKTSFDTAKALNVALSAAAVGVWAIFSLALGDLQAVIKSIPSHSLLVEVTDYIKGVFKNDEKIADPNYAGKLQFMVQGMEETVSCNSHYVSYSLERQLIELCKKLNIDESTPLDILVGDWDRIFKDDILSMVMQTHRSLIARWLKWALMVHHLREELARYTAVGVVGLVNSGKSLLVSTLFDIDVPVGTTAIKRTTVPFLYNLDGVIDGLDVIDFPGVDDRDETIPDLAELLLSIAQVVIFVVDYRKAHTESSKKWLEMLEDKAVPVLVCLTYADKLYAEHMGEDGSHPDPRDVSQEITKETEMINEQLGKVPSHKVQFFSFSQDRDSVLNSPEGREKLQKADIGTPQDVGDWLAGIFESQLDQGELAEKIRKFVHRKK